MLLGVGAMVAAGGSGNSGLGQVGAAAIRAPQAIQSSLLAYMRAQEEQADRAAVKFLTATGQSPRACTTPSSASPTRCLIIARVDPYMQSHPMPSERVAALEGWHDQPYWETRIRRNCSCATT